MSYDYALNSKKVLEPNTEKNNIYNKLMKREK